MTTRNVTGSAWIERSFADGMRKCLADEFSNIYVVHLRGDVRKNMLSKGAAKEGGNIFGSSSMTGIAITFFVKNPSGNKHGEIQFHDIGDDLKCEEKLALLTKLWSINGITNAAGWHAVIPDKHCDWIGQRDEGFEQFLKIGDKKDQTSQTVFESYSLGVSTNRDTWCYNFSDHSQKLGSISMPCSTIGAGKSLNFSPTIQS
jgi:predicted helicase